MSVMQSEVYEAFRAIDIPEDKALKAATALSKRDDDVTSIKSELLVIKWRMGFVLAFQVAIFAKMFMHRVYGTGRARRALIAVIIGSPPGSEGLSIVSLRPASLKERQAYSL